MTIRIEGIYLTPTASGDMKSVNHAKLLENQGIEGDRYAKRCGTYSCLRASKFSPGEPEPGRQLTMISADSVESALQKNDIKVKSLGLMMALWMEAGVSCQILQGGTISLGDKVTITQERMPYDDGDQSPGFYIPPNQRTAGMVREALEHKRRLAKELQPNDPTGYQRAEESYNAVGLVFWPKPAPEEGL